MLMADIHEFPLPDGDDYVARRLIVQHEDGYDPLSDKNNGW